MLDLIISYFNFLILSIGYIVKRFTFFPPDPPHYKSIPTNNQDEEDIIFLIHNKKKEAKYINIEFRHIDYRYIKIIDKDNNSLPILLFYPPSHIPVCIIYSHGNSGDLGSCLLEYYDIALNTNCFVISFEYPGYGECKNQPLVESQFNKNLKMTYYFVKKILGFKSEQIILYGFSLGTGIMFELACKKQNCAAGLILQSPFLSIIRTLYNVKKTSFFDLFNNCDKAKHLCIKTFFIHGNKDSMVPYIHGRILAKLIPRRYFYDFLTVDGADHNNIFKINKELIYKRIRLFIKDCTGYNPDIFKNKKKMEKSSDDTIKNNLNKEKENINNNSSNKLNRSGEIISPSLNLMNYSPNLNINSFNKEINLLINNNNYNYNNPYFNNNLFKIIYPLNNINNFNNLQNQNIFFPFSQANSEMFKTSTNEINNMQELTKLKPVSYNNNIFLNTNNNQGNFNNGMFNQYIISNNNTNSTLMGLNEII